jgi:D-ribose pyranase
MIISGIVNPQLLSLLCRVRHTNSLVIADVGFPSWPGIETVDLSLVHGIPTVLQVVNALRARWKCG